MGGHSRWAATKHESAVIDAKRGKLLAKPIEDLDDVPNVDVSVDILEAIEA